MSRVTEKQRSAWADHITKQPASKLSQRAYCERHSLNLRQFGYWRRVFHPTATFETEAKSKQVPSRKFVPVQITTRSVNHTITITLPNGVLIGGINDENQHLIPSLLSACI